MPTLTWIIMDIIKHLEHLAKCHLHVSKEQAFLFFLQVLLLLQLLNQIVILLQRSILN